MNKEQIAKHGEVIKWFCDNADKGVWCKYVDKWECARDPNFHHNLTIVQNDEYAELRKAQADSKVIEQAYSDEHGSGCLTETWGELTSFSLPIQCYRIKPDEPKFKVGDWLTMYSKKPFQATEAGLKQWGDMDILKLWQPKEGEWCWFWDNDWTGNTYIVARFDGIHNDKYKALDFNVEDSYENIAPLEFIQGLK